MQTGLFGVGATGLIQCGLSSSDSSDDSANPCVRNLSSMSHVFFPHLLVKLVRCLDLSFVTARSQCFNASSGSVPHCGLQYSHMALPCASSWWSYRATSCPVCLLTLPGCLESSPQKWRTLHRNGAAGCQSVFQFLHALLLCSMPLNSAHLSASWNLLPVHWHLSRPDYPSAWYVPCRIYCLCFYFVFQHYQFQAAKKQPLSWLCLDPIENIFSCAFATSSC